MLTTKLGHSIRFSKVQCAIKQVVVHAVDHWMSSVPFFVSPSNPKESLTVLNTLVAVDGNKRCCRSARAEDLAAVPLFNHTYQLSKVRWRYFLATIISKGCARCGKYISISFRHSDLDTAPIIKESALAYVSNTALARTSGGYIVFVLHGPVLQTCPQAATAAATRHVVLRAQNGKCVLCTQKIIVWARSTPRRTGRFPCLYGSNKP